MNQETANYIVYGNTLVKRMQERGYSATIGYSREETNSFLKQYDKYFIETEDGLSMTPDITHNDLIQAFRGHLPLPVLYAILEIN